MNQPTKNIDIGIVILEPTTLDPLLSDNDVVPTSNFI